MLRPPPALGSKRPGDVFELLREGGRAARHEPPRRPTAVRIFTMSVGDLLDDYFETDELKGSIASTGVVGVWAGPYTPGTAYNLLHHALGELDGDAGRLGPRDAAAWARSPRRSPPPPAPPGPRSAPSAEVASIDVDGRPRHRRHPRRRRDAARADRRSPAPTPRARSSTWSGPSTSPTRSRGHAPLPHPRRLGEDQHGPHRAAALRQRRPPRCRSTLLHAGVNICPSIDYLERAWQDAPARCARRRARTSRSEVPDGDRPEPHRRRQPGC